MGDLLNFRPPVLVGERVKWLGSGCGMPLSATVRWIGRVPEITTGWTIGIELDQAMPVGGIDGTWRQRKLFSCQPKHGLLVPVDKIVKESSMIKIRHSIGERFYNETETRPLNPRTETFARQLSLPQSSSAHEFLSRVLPQNNRNTVPVEPPPETPLTFKSAASQVQQASRKTSLPVINCTKVAPLSVANVRTFESLSQAEEKQHGIASAIDELKKFKYHLEALENFKHVGHSATETRRQNGASIPESLYALAKKGRTDENPLVLGLIGEKLTKPIDAPDKSCAQSDDRNKRVNVSEPTKSPRTHHKKAKKIKDSEHLAHLESKRLGSNIVSCIREEQAEDSVPLLSIKPINKDPPVILKETIVTLPEAEKLELFDSTKVELSEGELRDEEDFCTETAYSSAVQVLQALEEESEVLLRV